MPSADRLPLFPSRANLVLVKQRVYAAKRGLHLLKRKRDALELKVRELNAKLAPLQTALEDVMRAAIFSIAKANYLGADTKPAAVVQVDRADIFIRINSQKVVGQQLPNFELIMREPSCFPLTGLSRGGVQVEVVRQKFQEATAVLVSVASLKFSVNVLQDAVRNTNMRINGLDFVVIPRFQNTLSYITDELDEYEREDFYRLKRSQAKQMAAKQKFRRMLKLNHLKSLGIQIPATIDDNFDVDEFEKVALRELEAQQATEA